MLAFGIEGKCQTVDEGGLSDAQAHIGDSKAVGIEPPSCSESSLGFRTLDTCGKEMRFPNYAKRSEISSRTLPKDDAEGFGRPSPRQSFEHYAY